MWVTLILMVAAAVAAVVVFANNWGQFTQDAFPQLYLAPGRTLVQSLFSWKTDPLMGQPNINTGMAPVAAIILLLRAVGLPAWAVVRVLRLALLIAAGWASLRFYEHVAGERATAVGRVVAAVVYVANPYVLVSGATAPILIPFALLPWLLLAFARGVEEPASWRWPAIFALVFFLMGGMVGGVVPILMLVAVPCYMLFIRRSDGVPLRRSARTAGRAVGLCLWVSLYWLVGSAVAGKSGLANTLTTERVADIAATSSYSESLRLLGIWTLYGYSANLASYVTNPFVVAATFVLPTFAAVSAWLSRSRIRTFSAILLAVAVPFMVGAFPPSSSSPFGVAMRAAFQRFPATMAFRTTNKIGALAVLAITLLIALGAAELFNRTRRRPWLRAPLAAFGVMVVVAASWPAFSGQLYRSSWTLPGYWRSAASDVNAGPSDTRVMFVPGDFWSVYRWGMDEGNDLNESVLSRPSVLRQVVLTGPLESANYLAALDVPLHVGSYRKGLLPTMAGYMGVRDVLVRNDVVWERFGGVPPAKLAGELTEPDLRLVRDYGGPGQNVRASPSKQSFRRTPLHPLQLFQVADPRPVVRAEPARGTLLIDGDNFALDSLVPLGILSGSPSFRLMGSLSESAFEWSLEHGAHVVVTDSNRRRVWNFRRAGADYGETLSPSQGGNLGEFPSYALYWDDPDRQTVSFLRGARSITATQQGSVFQPVPSALAAFAFDGDVHTAWLAGDYGTAPGQSISIAFDHPMEVSQVDLRPLIGGPVEVAGVRIRVGSETVMAEVPSRPQVRVKIPPTRARSLTLTITQVRGVGARPVGFWEIGIPGVQVTRVVRVPRTLEELAAHLDAHGRSLLQTAPLDIVLTRETGNLSTSLDDEERTLDRRFDVPVAEDFTFTAQARMGPDLPETVIDGLAGMRGDIVATSSSRAFDSPWARASQAFDGDPTTAWVPAFSGQGAWIDVRFPPQRLDHLVVHQGTPGQAAPALASQVEVSIDGGPAMRASLNPNSTRIDFPAATAHEIRVTITGVTRSIGGIRINEIELGKVRISPTDQSTPLHGCVELFNLDGVTASARPTGTFGQLVAGQPLTFTVCRDAPISVPAGTHELRSSQGWLIDLMDLAWQGEVSSGLASQPSVRVRSASPTRLVLAADRSDGPYYLVTGQAFDERWRAAMDGHPLGPPELFDGYSTGWLVDKPGPHVFVITYAPQRALNVAEALSFLGLAVALVLALRRRAAG